MPEYATDQEEVYIFVHPLYPSDEVAPEWDMPSGAMGWARGGEIYRERARRLLLKVVERRSST